MISEIIRNASDAAASFGRHQEAQTRIRVGDKKVTSPWIFNNGGYRTVSERLRG